MKLLKKIKEFFVGKEIDTHVSLDPKGVSDKSKNYPYKKEPQEELPANMTVNPIYKGIDGRGKRIFDVNGIVLDAEDIWDASRKYLKQKKEEDESRS